MVIIFIIFIIYRDYSINKWNMLISALINNISIMVTWDMSIPVIVTIN